MKKLVFSLVKSRGHHSRQGCRCILKQSRGLPLVAVLSEIETNKIHTYNGRTAKTK
jgi:hypothetical protein